MHAALGITTTWASAREVWRALSNRVPELASFEWDTRAPPAREARGLKPIPAAADGRPPGYREFGAPRVRGI
jgi:NADH-quinone oxidoreductase subunit G